MNVYLLTTNPMLVTYGEDYAYVVIAPDEEMARLMAARTDTKGRHVNWNKFECAVCELIDLSLPRVVLAANVGA